MLASSSVLGSFAPWHLTATDLLAGGADLAGRGERRAAMVGGEEADSVAATGSALLASEMELKTVEDGAGGVVGLFAPAAGVGGAAGARGGGWRRSSPAGSGC
ncbi:hypothetical protein ACLOJK_029806 [Asimina triloba]